MLIIGCDFQTRYQQIAMAGKKLRDRIVRFKERALGH
jgi:hypothetical protein